MPCRGFGKIIENRFSNYWATKSDCVIDTVKLSSSPRSSLEPVKKLHALRESERLDRFKNRLRIECTPRIGTSRLIASTAFRLQIIESGTPTMRVGNDVPSSKYDDTAIFILLTGRKPTNYAASTISLKNLTPQFRRNCCLLWPRPFTGPPTITQELTLFSQTRIFLRGQISPSHLPKLTLTPLKVFVIDA